MFRWELIIIWVYFCVWAFPSFAGERQIVSNTCAEDAIAGRIVPFEMVGESPAMDRVRFLIDRIAPLSNTVLIRGESGTGKELVASAIHDNSPRRKNPFVTLNVGAVAETLMESELFGHEKGAFTGAVKRRAGVFERADGGTLFLDEFGEMSAGMQVKLLRVLEGHPFQRVGGQDEIRPDVRLVLATNKNLEKEVRRGTFREDLFFRIMTFPIELPPLRDRKEDVIVLARYFLHQLGPALYEMTDRGPIEGFTAEAEAILKARKWFGNVRELRHTVERAIVFLPKELDQIGAEHVTGNDVNFGEAQPLVMALDALESRLQEGLPTRWSTVEKELLGPYVRAVLVQNSWVKKHAAEQLGVSVAELNSLIKKFELRRDE